MYAVCVTFEIKAGRMSDFLPLMQENARTSRLVEDGCHQFEVATDPDRRNAVFLYEIYSDRAAFDEHLASPHFQAFDAATSDMIASKAVATWSEVKQ